MSAVSRPEPKSVWVTYLLWFFGGFFGLHHLYLHRDRHAFIWWCSLGGYFGVGWLSEILTIPKMVKDANEDPEFIKEFIEKLQKYQKPQFSTNRFIGAIMIGYLYGQLIQLAMPEDTLFGINWSFMHWFIPLASALGIWTVGNIGREQGVLWHCLLSSYLVYPIRYWVYDETYWFTAMVFISALVFDIFSKQWQRQPPKRHGKCRRAAILVPAVLIYLALWSSYFVFNGKITDSEGDEVPVYEAIKNFFTSPWWTDLQQTWDETLLYANHHGWYETWKVIIDSMDVDGEQNAFKVLGVSATASQSEITAAWRKLSKENHPDKIKDETKRRDAQDKFMEIQQAYEVLSKIKSRRRKRNKQFDDEL